MADLAKVNFAPPKSFFVEMLVRDIEMKDAILDLLDNCVDGIQRVLRGDKPDGYNADLPYRGFFANITLNSSEFSLEDNCGGIPRQVAIESAFRLGRPDTTKDNDLDTVGMYGIGMKRAIFKLGDTCTVYSRTPEGSYNVKITPEWLRNDDEYHLELNDTDDELQACGTKIHVTRLHDNIARSFTPGRSPFTQNLKDEISKLFLIIIKKGFSVSINGYEITPKDLSIMVPAENLTEGETGIEPYLFKATIDGVKIELAVGFYRALATDNEIDEELIEKKTSENAGWSVICNDRLVLHADKTHLSGWGTSGVPNYHTQFISIAGFVRFQSTDAMRLPLNTTKRGLDTSSALYFTMLDVMREGIKHFISYTNRWKGRVNETQEQFRKSQPLKIEQISEQIQANTDQWTNVRKLTVNDNSASKHEPRLEVPPKTRTHSRITYSKPIEEIALLKAHFFEDMDVDAVSSNEVGEAAFDECLTKAGET